MEFVCIRCCVVLLGETLEVVRFECLWRAVEHKDLIGVHED